MSALRSDQKPSALPAVIWLGTSERRFVDLQMLEVRLAGEPEGGWAEQAKSGRRAIRESLAKSMLKAIGGLAMALLAAYVMGAVHPSMNWHWGKALQTAGGAVAMWATLFALGEPLPTWKRNSLAERVHRLVFALLMVAGSSLALWGTLL